MEKASQEKRGLERLITPADRSTLDGWFEYKIKVFFFSVSVITTRNIVLPLRLHIMFGANKLQRRMCSGVSAVVHKQQKQATLSEMHQ